LAPREVQGLDLSNTRILHQLEELPSRAQEKQLDGRTVRTLANCDYPPTQAGWTNIKYVYVFDNGEVAVDLVTHQARVSTQLSQLQPLLSHLQQGIHEYKGILRHYQDAQQQVLRQLEKLMHAKLHPTAEADAMAKLEQGYAIMKARKVELTSVEQQLLAQSNVAPTTMHERLQELDHSIQKLQAEAAHMTKTGQPLIATMPSIEAQVRRKAGQDYVLLEAFNLALRQVALDCPTLRPINNLNSDMPAITCGINADMHFSTLQHDLLHLFNALRGK
jgi:hypothetical protein